MNRFRVGTKAGRTIYDGDVLIGVMDTPELALMFVGAANADQGLVAAERKRCLDIVQKMARRNVPTAEVARYLAGRFGIVRIITRRAAVMAITDQPR